MDPYYMTPVDHIRRWLAPYATWATLRLAILAGLAVLPVVQVDRAARAAGQGPVMAWATAAAGVVLAAAAAWEAPQRRGAAAYPAYLGLAAPVLVAAWCALQATPHAPARSYAPGVLAVWPCICAVGAVLVRLGRADSAPPEPPTRQAEQIPEPTLSRAEPTPGPAAQHDEPQVSDPPTEPTKTAQLLALAARIPADDPRRPTALADDLAAEVGMHQATARRILAQARRTTRTAAVA
jgi:hypothetical protein